MKIAVGGFQHETPSSVGCLRSTSKTAAYHPSKLRIDPLKKRLRREIIRRQDVSKVLCSDRQWVDPKKQPSFSRALASLIRLGYLETVSWVSIIDSEGDPPF
jgi:hypothetical protein